MSIRRREIRRRRSGTGAAKARIRTNGSAVVVAQAEVVEVAGVVAVKAVVVARPSQSSRR